MPVIMKTIIIIIEATLLRIYCVLWAVLTHILSLKPANLILLIPGKCRFIQGTQVLKSDKCGPRSLLCPLAGWVISGQLVSLCKVGVAIP